MTAAVLSRMALDLLFPPRCIACREPTDMAHGLCPACWRETPFVAGPVCGACGVPVPEGPAGGLPGALRCTACLERPRAWDRGRAALLYDGTARSLVLALKHGDRLELARPLSAWMARAGAELLAEGPVLVPVPLHWRRLLARRANQSAELARAIARGAGLRMAPGLLRRIRATGSQEGRDRAAREAGVRGAFAVPARARGAVAGGRFLLVDDVMTSGATLSEAAVTLKAAGAAAVDVLVAARVAREGSG